MDSSFVMERKEIVLDSKCIGGGGMLGGGCCDGDCSRATLLLWWLRELSCFWLWKYVLYLSRSLSFFTTFSLISIFPNKIPSLKIFSYISMILWKEVLEESLASSVLFVSNSSYNEEGIAETSKGSNSLEEGVWVVGCWGVSVSGSCCLGDSAVRLMGLLGDLGGWGFMGALPFTSCWSGIRGRG